MRTVLVTGSEGLVGRAAAARLEAEGWSVRGFDISAGDDLRDERAVLAAVGGCDAVVHAGAIAHDSRGTPADIVATNVLGDPDRRPAGRHDPERGNAGPH